MKTDDILSEFDAFLRGDAGGRTVQEIADATGTSVFTVRRRIKDLMAQGKAERCGSKMCVDISGISRPSPTYRVVKANQDRAKSSSASAAEVPRRRR